MGGEAEDTRGLDWGGEKEAEDIRGLDWAGGGVEKQKILGV